MQLIRNISLRLAAVTMLVLLSCVVVFHLLVLSGAVPYDIAWGGRLQSQAQMYQFEAISLTVNLAVLFIVAMRGGYIKPYLPAKAVTVALWVLVILFALNTAGNLFAQTWLETIVFTPLTLLGAILFYRMAIEQR